MVGVAQVSVLAVDRPKRNADHPTSKPVELVRRCIRNSTRLADVVYDPFLGSGTTLIACETEGRRCFGLEIEPKYVDVIVARWEKISGGEAILDGSDGLTFAKVRAGRLEQWQDEVMEEAVR
jgi:site-specific DNA-methyltransferase (adenine-specific)